MKKWNLIKLMGYFCFILFCVFSFGKASIAEAEESQWHVVDMETGDNTAYDVPQASGDVVTEPEMGFLNSLMGQKVGNGISVNAIIGNDDRWVVTNASSYPYTAIARLTVTYQDGSMGFATGFMIGPKLMATAGHVLINDAFSHVRSMKMEFGLYNSSCFYTTSSFSSYIYYGGYAGIDANTDYGFVVMSSNVGTERTGHFGIRTAADPNQFIYLAGYSGGEPKIYLGVGNVIAITNEIITYNVDMKKGQSGGPVYVLYDGLPYAMAINSVQVTDAVTDVGLYNAGRRIDYGLYEWLHNNGYI